jgi:predicted NAD-dependent protein-ADP-ribosyltransferase YbiA (DUF1768 family)
MLVKQNFFFVNKKCTDLSEWSIITSSLQGQYWRTEENLMQSYERFSSIFFFDCYKEGT